MSPASSGGVFSRASLTASTIRLTGSVIASRTSSELISTIFGIPEIRSRPLTSILLTSCPGSGKALPIVILITSPDLSPIRRLYFRFMYWTISSSILSPATRTDFE